MPEQDPRLEERDICGIIHTMDDGCEWICIKEPHDAEYRRKHPKGKPTHFMSNNKTVDFHYFVPLYPQREERHET